MQDLGAPEEWRMKGVVHPYAPQIEALKQLPLFSSPFQKARVLFHGLSTAITRHSDIPCHPQLMQEVFNDIITEAEEYHAGKYLL